MRTRTVTQPVTARAAAVAACAGCILLPFLVAAPSVAQAPAAPAPAAPAPAAPAPAAPASPPPNYKIQYNGLIDGYYMYQLNGAKGTSIGADSAREYDVRLKTPTLSLAEINVFRVAPPNGVGFKTTLITGDTAAINHFNFNVNSGTTGGSNEGQFQNIQQLYATYLLPGPGYGINIGKFYTPFGYEVTESNANYNYSRSLPYFLLPVYHAGASIYTPTYDGFTLTGYVVNALYNTQTAGIHNDNKQAKFIGQLNYTDPKGKFVAIENFGAGNDELPNTLPGVASTGVKEILSDTDFTYNLNANMLFGLNYTYISQDPDGGDVNYNGGNKITDNGWAGYWKQTLTPKTSYAVRVSGFKQELNTAGVTNPSPWEASLDYDYKAASNFTTGIEYRHDGSNVEQYLGNSETAAEEAAGTATLKKSEDTLTVFGQFTFP